MTGFTPAREADTEYVLHRSRLTGDTDCPVHLPSDENPDEPRCGTRRQSGKPYQRRDIDEVPEGWNLCCHCDPDYHIPHPGKSRDGTLASRLFHADPDDVGRNAMEASD